MILEYHVPQLGKITAELFPLAENTYRLLDKYGHIERMKKIDQLGVIRSVYQGAHHSRWEYVMVQLSLINHLRNENGVGLSNNFTDISGEKPSGAEVLQILVLLFNAGHLPGTFSTERALLKYCKKNKSFQKNINNGLPKGKMRGYFKDIVEKNKVYNFHKILISFHLERYRRLAKCQKIIDFLQELLINYIFGPEKNIDKHRKHKNQFHRIRQVSYLFLDSKYGPVPFNFELSQIFLNFSDYKTSLFMEKENSIISTFNSFDNFLSTNIYHSAEAIREMGIHSKYIESFIERNYDNLMLNKISGFQKFLINNYDDLQPRPTKTKNTFNAYILFDNLQPFIAKKIENELSYENEEIWNKKYGKSFCNLTFQSAPTSKQFAIVLTLLKTSNYQKNVEIIGNFLKDFVDLKIKIVNEFKSSTFYSSKIDDIFQIPFQMLLMSILNYISEDNLYFGFKDSEIERHILAIKGSKKAAIKIGEIIEEINPENSRLHELKTIQKSLHKLSIRPTWLISLSEILVDKKDGQNVTDIDGLCLCYNNKKLGVLIVEAKDQKQSSQTDSVKRLEKTLDKLNFKTSIDPDIIQIEKGAYCYLTIDGK